jgi:hypothetical protein
VAQANLRLAAGIGAVATCLLVGGPSVAVAMADPGGGHSGHSGVGKGSDDSGRGSSRGGSDWSDDNINGDSRGDTNSENNARPSSKVGSGREAGTSVERPSSDYSPDPPEFKTPKVTFGDGRTPGLQDHDPEPRWRSPAPIPAPPPPPEVITDPLNPPAINPVHKQTGVVQHLVVAPTAGVADPLWAVAGLLLIPAAGAILGYRQARAAQSAAELVVCPVFS